MSGQPNINPTDASKFRQQYLANLALQARNDQINLEANKIFKKTGQTPTQPTDTRTTAEKLADIERLKLDIRGGLKDITDGAQANIIVNNLSPDEMVFLAQQLPTIIADLKPKYKNGILGAIFIPYFRKYKDKYDQTQGVEYGLQQDAGRQILLGIEQIQRDMVDADLLARVEENILGATSQMSKRRTEQIRREINELRQIIPTAEDIEQLRQIDNPITRAEIQELLNDALQELPTKVEIMTLMYRIEQSQAQNNQQLSDQLLAQLQSILQIEPATKADMEEIKQMIFETFRQRGKDLPEAESFPPEEAPLASAEVRQPTSASLPEDQPLTEEEKRDLDRISQNEKIVEAVNKIYNTTNKLKERGNGEARKSYIELAQGLLGKPSIASLVKSVLGQKSQPSTTEEQIRVIKWINRRYSYIKNGGNEEPVEASGYGLKKPRKRRSVKGGGVGVPHLQADYSKAIIPDIKYTPVGRYFLDHRKLSDNIISLKRGNGVNVSGFPIQRVSNDLGDVIRTIIGGGQPKYEKLEKLSQEEKSYLHKLAKASQIIDRINIPAPSKDDDEKDIHNFEVMKGEILSGNDSQELIKKFKLLIVKMINKGLLPKTQAKDILMNLATLGY